MSNSWSGGSTRRWRKLRQAILERDGFVCLAHADGWCDKVDGPPHQCRVNVELSGPNAGHAHHTLGRSVTGDDPASIVTACQPCNHHIGDPTANNDPIAEFDPSEW